MFYKKNKDGAYKAVCSVCGKQYGERFVRALEAFQYAKDTAVVCEKCKEEGHEHRLDHIMTKHERAELRRKILEKQVEEVLASFRKTHCVEVTAEELGFDVNEVRTRLRMAGFEGKQGQVCSWKNPKTGEEIVTVPYQASKDNFGDFAMTTEEANRYANLIVRIDRIDKYLGETLKTDLMYLKRKLAGKQDISRAYGHRIKRRVISCMLAEGWVMELKLTNPRTNEELFIPTSKIPKIALRYIDIKSVLDDREDVTRVGEEEDADKRTYENNRGLTKRPPKTAVRNGE